MLHGTTKTEGIISDVVPNTDTSLRNSSAMVKCHPISSGECTNFALDNKYDCIRPPEVRALLPAIKVRDEVTDVRIAWPMNVFHRIMGENYLSVDGVKLCPHDPVTMDIEQQCFHSGTQSKRDQHMNEVGNHRDTLSFGRKLPSKYLRHTLGGVYNADVPLYIFALDKIHSKQFVHVFTFELMIKKLLRMEIKKKGKWVPVLNCEEKLQYIEVENGLQAIATPTVFAMYVNYSPEEKDSVFCRLGNLPEFNPIEPGEEGISIRFRQYMKMNTTVQPSQSSVVATPLKSPYPTVAIISVSANQQAVRSSGTSNYTTNPGNPEVGEDPVETVGIVANGKEIVPENTPTAYLWTDYQTINSPIHQGYRIHSFCKDLSVSYPDSSNVITDGMITNTYRANTKYKGQYIEHNYLVAMREYRYVKVGGNVVIRLVE